MSWKVQLKKSAAKYIAGLPYRLANAVNSAITEVSLDPYSAADGKLSGRDNQYKKRVGHLRIIYSIYDDEVVVEVLKVGPRGDVYK